MNTYNSENPLEYTLLTYRPRADTDAWVEQWVKEGDFDKRKDLVCFKPNGDPIAISPDNEVFEFVKEIKKWRSPAPRQVSEVVPLGTLRQKTVYVRRKIGVEARFKPIYEQGHMNNV